MRRIHVILPVVAIALLGACVSTKHARDVEPSGFLAEYRSLLQPGKEGEALLRYRNPEADWASYKKILLEPVTIWQGPDSKFTSEQREDLQRLVDGFYNLLYVKLSKDYEMVNKPEADTMRIQAAITHGEGSVTGATVVSKVVPQARLVNAVWTLGSGKPAFAGEISIDAIVKDAQTGKLLAAGSDRRVGGVNLFDKEVFNSWGDVKNSLDFWADAAVWRLCVLRGETTCVQPKA